MHVCTLKYTDTYSYTYIQAYVMHTLARSCLPPYTQIHAQIHILADFQNMIQSRR